METKVAALCTIGAILGLLSVVLGFAAEATKVKDSQISPDVENNVCIYPKSPASVLGFASVLALLVALITINVAGGCFCCKKRRDREYPLSTSRCECNPSLVLFIFSWITFVPAFLLMLGAAILSANTNMERLRTGDSFYSYCYYVKPGVFAAAACLSFISVALGITYTLNLASTSEKGGNGGQSAYPAPQGGGIAMGHAQVPTTTQQSGYPVYGETYTRP